MNVLHLNLFLLLLKYKGLLLLTKLSGIDRLLREESNFEIGEEEIENSSTVIRQVATYEKNVESLLINESGVFLIYDNNQAIRKPLQLYNHLKKKCYAISHHKESADYFENLFVNCLHNNFILELSNDGHLRIIFKDTESSAHITVNLVNLNEYFIALLSSHSAVDEITSNFKLNNAAQASTSSEKSSLEINVRLVANVNGMRHIPAKVMRTVFVRIKLLFQSIFRRRQRHLN